MMNIRKIIKQSVACLSGGLFLGCTGSHSFNSTGFEGLAQERLFLNEKSFVKTQVKPTIAYPTADEESGIVSKDFGVSAAIIGAIAPKLIDSSIDIVANGIVSLSGKNDETRTIDAEVSNFFYKDENYNMLNDATPELNIVFVSAVFGDSEETWVPKDLDSSKKSAFKRLNIVGKPNFYMEAKIFPIPGNKYMEIVPTYMFYNRLFNSKGLDMRRDLAINFSFLDVDNSSEGNLISSGNIIFRDVKVGKEYGAKELANVRTKFMEMPTISSSKDGYSGAYDLNIKVTETRDVNEWLAALGESISSSKAEIGSALYVTKKERIRLKEKLQKSEIALKLVELKIAEAKENGASESELLELESELIEAEATVETNALDRGTLLNY